jgi:epoxyqueuosine reductase
VKQQAEALGFALCGVSGPLEKKHTDFYEWWVQQGYGAGMFYLRSQLSKRQDLEKILPDAKAVIMLAMPFPGGGQNPPDSPSPAGKVARYAVNEDYHHTLLPKVQELAEALDRSCGSKSLAYVDTGALNERAYAAQGGIGWIGKNAMLIHPDWGSWLWLASIVTTAPLAPDPLLADHCGKCRKCIEACPTGAILENLRAVDSNKCIPYWNIEHRGEIPETIATKMDPWILGCDICQEVCPWNSHSLKMGRKDMGEPLVEWQPLAEILQMEKSEFGKFQDRAHSRAKWEGWQRNAKILETQQQEKKKT